MHLPLYDSTGYLIPYKENSFRGKTMPKPFAKQRRETNFDPMNKPAHPDEMLPAKSMKSFSQMPKKMSAKLAKPASEKRFVK